MKTPLNVLPNSAEPVAAARSCGGCTACCVLPHIARNEEFPEGKPGYLPCKHLCGDGCSIYEERPQLCRTYLCLWRAGIIAGDERRRPDKVGLMFTVDVVGNGLAIEAWELWDGAASEHPGRGVLDAIGERYKVMIRFYGVPCSINYDRPECFGLGPQLSALSKDDPAALVRWCEDMMDRGWLTSKPKEVESVQQDLGPMRRGESVERFYKKGVAS